VPGPAWLLTMKPTFLTEWSALPPKESHQVQRKLQLLVEDPNPDGHLKKKLKHMGGKLHRLRSGDYRIFYVFEAPYVSLLKLDKRDEQTYGDELDDESLGGLDAALAGEKPKEPDWQKLFASKAPAKKTPLPAKITPDLLANLKVPANLHKKLLPLETQEDLLGCPGVPEDLLLKIDEALIEKPLAEVVRQPDLVATSVDDLLKFKEGELLGFLLKLNPEQEKFVTWGLKANGPTLLKGGPGTGKSTVALYRARAMLQSLRKAGVQRPRILFTTYTSALVSFSKQLLSSLLGPEAELIDIRTADSLVTAVAGGGKVQFEFADKPALKRAIKEAAASAKLEGNRLQQMALRQAIDRLPLDYLAEEIDKVIDARAMASLEEYLAAVRPGRGLALNALQRKAVWLVRDAYRRALEKLGLHTWQSVRGLALARARARAGEGPAPYDAVIVDEAQDLDACVLQLLVELCAAPNRLFLTADANQSVYGSGYRWSDVHAQLRFQGHTGILKANHRSTREIGEAAHAYLAGGAIEAEEAAARTYVNNGPLPVLRRSRSLKEELDVIARFLPAASKMFRLGLSGCAVFCPGEKEGRLLEEGLKARRLDAVFMNSKSLDLTRRCVKVMALRTAKGLEFPVVAIAGFPAGEWPHLPADLPEEERAEHFARERRALFVAMTRAMRGLLVLVPQGATSPVLQGLGGPQWNEAG
jgi:superfamily I DNA/RNA helicase/mRNA-degrading endonuclease RelE of RelBE toxin-antitoxin system